MRLDNGTAEILHYGRVETVDLHRACHQPQQGRLMKTKFQMRTSSQKIFKVVQPITRRMSQTTFQRERKKETIRDRRIDILSLTSLVTQRHHLKFFKKV